MPRVLVVLLGCLSLLSSCTQKMVCPAYQSAFIHDPDALRKKFSYFKEDSTPKILTVSKNRYLIIPEKSYRQKIRSMKSIEMKPVYVVIPDSLKSDKDKDPVKKNEFAGAEQDSTDRDTTSAAGVTKAKDSVYAITKDKEVRVMKYDRDSAKFHIEHITLNAEQDLYMWYHRDVLVLPDVRAAMEDQKKEKEAQGKAAKGEKKKVGFFGFFKNLFHKKQKTDTTVVGPPPPPPIDSDNPADSTAALEATPVPVVTPQPEQKKKKGLGGLFRKKDKVEDKPADQKKDPAKKEEDGF